MNEKEHNNVFEFSLYQENVLLCKKIFDADQFNPFTRYSIDIRDILPKIITKLQKILSKRNYNVDFEVGRVDMTQSDTSNITYDLFHYHQKIINTYPIEFRDEMRYNPQPIIQQIEDKTIRGVECKIGFYINNNPIVERLFYVDGFNPVARWSVDLIETVMDIVDIIFNQIKSNDMKNMWDDYDLINHHGLSINQIRELSTSKREIMLRRLGRK